MINIVLLVSRSEFLTKVMTCLELLECNAKETNLLCIVDGNDELYVKVRNMVSGSKFNSRLTYKLDYPGTPLRFDISERRRRISAAHNQAKDILQNSTGYVFSVEDDTTFGPATLKRLLKFMQTRPACSFVEGVEIGRWGTPYIGAWVADDVYDPKKILSVENKFNDKETTETPIDAGGLYCALIRADLYKQHTFHSENGLGPDINFGIENRQLGFESYILWSCPCTHLYTDIGQERYINPSVETKIVTLTKENEKKWRITS